MTVSRIETLPFLYKTTSKKRSSLFSENRSSDRYFPSSRYIKNLLLLGEGCFIFKSVPSEVALQFGKFSNRDTITRWRCVIAYSREDKVDERVYFTYTHI